MDVPGDGLLATMTHARLRAEQGDVDAARRILRALLERRPADAEARSLLEALAAPGAEVGGPRDAKVERLRAWLEAVAGARSGADREVVMLDGVLTEIHGAVEGLEAVFVVGMDGMIVAGSPTSDKSAWEWIVASYAEILRKLDDANREADFASASELVVTNDRAVLVIRRITPDYGLLAAVRPDSGSLGRTRFELRKAAVQLAPELED